MRKLIALGLAFGLSVSEAVASETPIHGVVVVLGQQGNTLTLPLDQLETLNRARIKQAKNSGFNLVRVQIPMRAYFPSPSAEEQDKTLRLAKDTIDSALAAGLKVSVTFEVPWETGARKVVCDGQYRTEYKAGFTQIVKQLPDSPNIVMEAMGEPPSCQADRPGNLVWSSFQLDLYQTMRSILPHVRYIVTATGWGTLDGLLKYDPRNYLSDPNTFYTFHFYEPFLFTHQQADFLRSDHINKYVQNLRWPYDPANASAVERAAQTAIQQDTALTADQKQADAVALHQLFVDYQTQGTAASLASRFDLAAKWAVDHHIPPEHIFIGEFGVRRPTAGPGKAGLPWATSSDWLAAVRKAAQSHNMNWVTWDLDSGFGVICANGHLCPGYSSAFGLEQERSQ